MSSRGWTATPTESCILNGKTGSSVPGRDTGRSRRRLFALTFFRVEVGREARRRLSRLTEQRRPEAWARSGLTRLRGSARYNHCMEVATLAVAAFAALMAAVAAAGAVATASATRGLRRLARRADEREMGDRRRSLYRTVTSAPEPLNPACMDSRSRDADLTGEDRNFVRAYRDRRDELLRPLLDELLKNRDMFKDGELHLDMEVLYGSRHRELEQMATVRATLGQAMGCGAWGTFEERMQKADALHDQLRRIFLIPDS